MIPAIPFLVLLLAVYSEKKQFYLLTLCLVFSCFFMGINLSDPFRGGNPSRLSFEFRVPPQMVTFDLLRGTVTDDLQKRKKRISYAKEVRSIIDTIHDKTAIIAGWWQGDLLLQQDHEKQSQTLFLYYASENALDSLKQNGYKIYFLPQQDFFNDEKYGHAFTLRYAEPWH